MTIQITDPKFGVSAIDALTKAHDSIREMGRLGLISPQEAANLASRFLHLEAQVFHGLEMHIEAGMVEAQAAQIFTQPTLWDEVA